MRRVRRLSIAAVLAGLCVHAAACDQSVPQPPPTTSGAAAKATTGDDDDAADGASDASGSSFGAAAGTSSDATGSSATAEPASFARDGAQTVGDDASKKSVKDCGATGKLYDRFADTPACTAVDLAKIDCTEAGITAALASNDKLTGEFKAALGTTYAGMEVDQCVDCPVGTTIPQCQTSKPPANGGTKVLFVKMDGTNINGKGMMLPIRPFQK